MCRHRFLLATSLVGWLAATFPFGSMRLHGQESSSVTSVSADTVSSLSDQLRIPANATADQLEQLIERANQLRPETHPDYLATQNAILSASKKLLELLSNERGSERFQRIELEAIKSAVALMAFSSPESQQKASEQVAEFLKGRNPLSLSDVQTGILAASMLEMQPNKKPARDLYQLMDSLLEKDQREEMQSLRLNLQASVRRLELLGKKLELAALDINGNRIQVDDFAGKFLIVDFFATWCQPCLSDLERIKVLHAKYKERGLEVISISLDHDRETLDKYLTTADLSWPVIYDSADDPNERLQMKFGVSTLPTVFLLNKEGTVVSLEAHSSELNRLMQMLFETPTPASPPPQANADSSNP
ncbi:MAG: TlpA family protein disulfide reductase [Planctomycetales bacterium]|nr:TlpA family protein disulfide reductase [Planctomycetales bacterium]